MLFHKIYIYWAEYNDSDFTRKCGFCSHNGPCESVAGFWGFVYGRNKWLCSVQEVQLAVISDPFLRCEVSRAHVFYVLSLYCIMSWIDLDWRYKFVLCHGNRGQNIAFRRVLRKSDRKGGAVVWVWFELLHLLSLPLSTNRHKDTVHWSKQTSHHQGFCRIFSFLISLSVPPSFPFSQSADGEVMDSFSHPCLLLFSTLLWDSYETVVVRT